MYANNLSEIPPRLLQMSDWARTPNEYGEIPLQDIIDVVIGIESYVTRRGGWLCITPRRIRDQILEYVQRRMRHAWIEISPPQHPQTIPPAWTSHAERIWTTWLTDTFPYEDWVREVMDPVFGTDERFWEARITTQWRREIFGFLPFWIERDWDIVDAYDPLRVDERTTSASWELEDADDVYRSRKR